MGEISIKKSPQSSSSNRRYQVADIVNWDVIARPPTSGVSFYFVEHKSQWEKGKLLSSMRLLRIQNSDEKCI